MKPVLWLIAFVTAPVWTLADEPASDEVVAQFEVTGSWKELSISDEDKREQWTVRMFKHSVTNDLLTIACLNSQGPKSLDSAVEFAPSGYPYWFRQNRPYTINRIKAVHVNHPTVLPSRQDTIAYTVVNEHHSDLPKDRLMANGFVFPMDSRTYYVQHSSHHPIPDWDALEVAESVIKSSKTSSSPPESPAPRTKP